MRLTKILLLTFCFLSIIPLVSAQDRKVTTAQPAAQPAANEAVKSVKYPALRDELMTRFNARREIRSELAKKYNGAAVPSAEMESVSKIDRENGAWMKSTIEKYGWPGKSMVGDDGAGAVFTLVMLANYEPEFYKQCAELLQKAVKDNEAPAAHLERLTARIRNAEQK